MTQMIGFSLRHGFAALQIRNYRLFWIGQVVGRTGTWMQQVSLPWLVLALGGSPTQLGIVAALEFAPALVLSPLGGVIADRVDKRGGIFVTQLIASIQVVILLGLVVTGAITIPLIMALSFTLGVANAIETPLRQSLAADLVPRPILSNAIALNAMAFNGARIVGPAIAGITIAIGTSALGTVAAGVAFNLAINAVSFIAVLATVAMMDPTQIRRRAHGARNEPVVRSLAEGVSYASRTPMVLWTLILVAIVATLGINFRILLPLFTQDVLFLDADTYGALYAALGVGAVAGAVTLAFMHERRVVALMLGGTVTFGIFLLGLAVTSSAAVAGLLLIGAGYSQMMLTNTANAAIQGEVSDDLRGRVVALYVTVIQGSVPIGGIVAGLLVEYGGVSLAFGVGSVASLAAAALVWRRLRRAGTSRATSTGP